MGHILEGSPGNIMTGLRPPGNQHAGTYTTDAITSTFLGAGAQAPSAPVEAPYGLFGGGTAATPTPESGGRVLLESWNNTAGSWNAPGSSAAIFHGYEQVQTAANGDAQQYDSGTDSDTQSDCGEGYSYEDVQHLEEDVVSQVLWTNYKHAKGRWREHERRPVRKVRRYFRKYLSSKGKGKGKCASAKGISTYATNLSDYDYQETFYGKGKSKGRGKLKGVRSSGKGAGRRTNPRGKDGQIMKCLGSNRQCGSIEHLVRDCPHEAGRNAGAQASPRQNASTNYVETVEMLWFIQVVPTEAPAKTFTSPKVGGAHNNMDQKDLSHQENLPQDIYRHQTIN